MADYARINLVKEGKENYSVFGYLCAFFSRKLSALFDYVGRPVVLADRFD